MLVARRNLGTVWEQLFPAEQHRILCLLVEWVQLKVDGLDTVWWDEGWREFRKELEQYPFVEEQ